MDWACFSVLGCSVSSLRTIQLACFRIPDVTTVWRYLQSYFCLYCCWPFWIPKPLLTIAPQSGLLQRWEEGKCSNHLLWAPHCTIHFNSVSLTFTMKCVPIQWTSSTNKKTRTVGREEIDTELTWLCQQHPSPWFLTLLIIWHMWNMIVFVWDLGTQPSPKDPAADLPSNCGDRYLSMSVAWSEDAD